MSLYTSHWLSDGVDVFIYITYVSDVKRALAPQQGDAESVLFQVAIYAQQGFDACEEDWLLDEVIQGRKTYTMLRVNGELPKLSDSASL